MDAQSLTNLIIEKQMAESLDAIEKVIKMPIISYDGNIPFIINETFLKCLELIKKPFRRKRTKSNMHFAKNSWRFP